MSRGRCGRLYLTRYSQRVRSSLRASGVDLPCRGGLVQPPASSLHATRSFPADPTCGVIEAAAALRIPRYRCDGRRPRTCRMTVSPVWVHNASRFERGIPAHSCGGPLARTGLHQRAGPRDIRRRPPDGHLFPEMRRRRFVSAQPTSETLPPASPADTGEYRRTRR